MWSIAKWRRPEGKGSLVHIHAADLFGMLCVYVSGMPQAWDWIKLFIVDENILNNAFPALSFQCCARWALWGLKTFSMLQHASCGRAERSTLCREYSTFTPATSTLWAAINPRHEHYITSCDRGNATCGALWRTGFDIRLGRGLCGGVPTSMSISRCLSLTKGTQNRAITLTYRETNTYSQTDKQADRRFIWVQWLISNARCL